MQILYYKIKNSQVTMIWEEEAKDFDKNWVYFTSWTEIDEIETKNNETWEIITKYEKVQVIIFDLDKNSSLPELKFLDSYKSSWWSSFNPFWPWFFFILLLWWVFLYFTFSTEDTQILPTESPIIASWSIENIVSNTLPWNNITDNNIEIVPNTISPVTPSINSNTEVSNLLTQIDWLELSNKRKDFEIQDLQIDFNRIQRELNISRSDLTEAKDIAKLYLNESLDKSWVIEDLKWQLLENNQLYLYLGEYLFDVCEDLWEDAQCKQIIFDFYNLRKTN